MKSIFQKILAMLARATIRHYQPIVIGITGTVGKTSTREAIYTVLRTKYRVRQSEKNYNTEIGVPLTILGIPHYGYNIFAWLSAFVHALFRILVRAHEYPEILVLEMGADRPGDIKHLAKIAPPRVAVLTAIGEIPAHVEFFSGPLDVAEEKAELIKALPSDGTLIYNGDDEALLEVKDKTRAPKLSFGFDEHTDFRIANYDLRIVEEQTGVVPDGIHFKIEQGKNVVPFRIHGAFGKPQAYAATAAAAVGSVFHMNLVEVAEALEAYMPPPGRARLLRGNKHTWIIDDTYNASPESMHAALDLLAMLPARRKIAVLGDMLEIGKYTEAAHRTAGDRVAKIAEALFTVGARAKFIADEVLAREKGVHADSSKKNVFSFDTPEKAGASLDQFLEPGDLVLVKGSQGMRMEKIVEEIMAEPQKAEELLVRQNADWRRRPFRLF